MPDESNQEEKTEQPTPRKREDARKKGQVARSQELNSIFIIFMGLLALIIFSGQIYSSLASVFFYNVSKISIELNSTSIYNLLLANGSAIVKILAPIMILLGVTGLVVNLAQVGLAFSPESIKPQFNKFNIAKGLKRLFSTRTLFSLVRDVTKVIIIGYITYATFRGEMNNYIPLADQGIGQIFIFAAHVAIKILLRASAALFVLAILDYAYQRYDFEKNLKMTKQEIKDELKKYEGDPLIKMRIRRVQREMARARMLHEVRKADVVVTNPTHIAVALKYDADTMSAPTLVAKGERLMAEKIKEIAEMAGIPIVENKPLARALFEAVEIGMTVPAKLYRAVAEVLAYVYKLKGKI